jgi:hypothetical protein
MAWVCGEMWLVTFVVTGLFPLDKPTTRSKHLLRHVLEGITRPRLVGKYL